MKGRCFLILTLILVFSFLIQPGMAQNFFHRGVNLTGWFDAANARSIPFTKFSKQDFQNIKSLGCDVIRLPIRLHTMTNGAPNYTVDTLFFYYLDQAIGWAEELDLNLILDNHTIEDAKSKAVETPLMKIWPQIANRYKDHSNNIYFEILNEPNTLSRTDWHNIQNKVVNAIRAIDTKHTIVVTGADWGGIYGLQNLPKLSDTNLIYSFHFYDPFLLTHQGASWTSPSLVDLANVPFPYDSARMPVCPASLKGTWVENSLKNDYKNDGTLAKIHATINTARNYAQTKKVRIYCGELGVYKANSEEEDRVRWYSGVTSYLDSMDIPWTMWDYQGGFGIFNEGSSEMFEYDINRPMAEGMGLTPPPFKEYNLLPDTVSFTIYDDYPGEGVIQGGAPGTGIADLFSADAYEGSYSVYLTGLAQYTNLDFDFKYNKDLSKLVSEDYVLRFLFKADSPGSSVVLRFLDTKTREPGDHPWRMDITLNTSRVPFDNQWHPVKIPLKNFVDIGSWDNGWFNSTNSFDWKATDRFQIVAEHAALTGKQFWFDHIRVTEPILVSAELGMSVPSLLVRSYPNPAKEYLLLEISGDEGSDMEVSIYDLMGREIKNLYQQKSFPGEVSLVWNLKNETGRIVPEGMYLFKVRVGGCVIVRKVSVIGG